MSRPRFECTENEPRIDRQSDERSRRSRAAAQSNRHRRDYSLLARRGAPLFAHVEGLADGIPSRVIDQQQAQRDRQQIEEAIVPGDGDRDLKKDHQSSGNQTWTPWRPDEKWDDDFHDETKRD